MKKKQLERRLFLIFLRQFGSSFGGFSILQDKYNIYICTYMFICSLCLCFKQRETYCFSLIFSSASASASASSASSQRSLSGP